MNAAPTKKIEPLIFVEKTKVFLIRQVYPNLGLFRKAERFFLIPQLKGSLAEVMALGLLANNYPADQRMNLYRKIDAKLKYILILIEVARDSKQIKPALAGIWQGYIAELGRILGGLIKAAKAKIAEMKGQRQ